MNVTQVNFKPTLRPYTGARIELPPPRDPLVFAREELVSYMAFARALPHNWHYKTCTPVTNGILGLKKMGRGSPWHPCMVYLLHKSYIFSLMFFVGKYFPYDGEHGVFA